MVNNSNTQLDLVFGALSDPTRRAMIERLASGDKIVGELGESFRMSSPAITKHVRVLERAGLLSRKKQGRTLVCTLKPAPMTQAVQWIEKHRAFWETQFDSLEQFFKTPAGQVLVAQSKKAKPGNEQKRGNV